jgi:hypothetical protein
MSRYFLPDPKIYSLPLFSLFFILRTLNINLQNENYMPGEANALEGAGDAGETVGSISKEAASLGSMFQPGYGASEGEEGVPCTPIQTYLPFPSLLYQQDHPQCLASAQPEPRRSPRKKQGPPPSQAPAEPELQISPIYTHPAILDDGSTGSTMTDALIDVVTLATRASTAAPEPP